ncbi:MAG: phosphoribosyltransferase family protein [Gammaproteobacteria bacterium]|nr:phosphoribosyltransferase family protein [Gammaproteobacteria bacterium]
MRNRGRVFRDRTQAGTVLAGMLEHLRGTDTLVLGIPAGGVPVAAEIAKQLGLALDLAVVSKITLPWNTESGYGAVAFDGSVRLNRSLIMVLGLPETTVEEGITRTKEKVARRVSELCGNNQLPDVTRHTVILVDDGLASGFTMHAAVDALYNLAADKVIVAVPTGHAEAVERIAASVDALYCPNIRQGMSFAVADAYEQWTDVSEETVAGIMQSFTSACHPA